MTQKNKKLLGAFRAIGRGYENIYSALYEDSLRRWHGNDYMASWMTACGMTVAVGMNVVLMIHIVVTLAGPLPTWPGRPLVLMLLTGVILANYTAFVLNDRYQKLVERFRRISDDARRRVTILAWVYWIASLAVPLAFVLIVGRLEKRPG